MGKKRGDSSAGDLSKLSFDEEKEKFMGMISEELAKRDFKTPEEAQEFLNNAFTGQTMGHSLAEWDTREVSQLDEARDILRGIGDDVSEVTVRKSAKKALEVSRDCMEAWQTLAWSYQSFEKIEENLLKGISHGRELHAELIESVDREHGLWGYHEARPFMRLLQDLASLYGEEGLLSEEVKVLEEMILLNPSDNQGVRGALLHKYLGAGRFDEAEALLEQFSDDIDLGIVYGRVLHELLRILYTDFDFEILEKKIGKGPILISSFGPEFAKAKRLMKKAIEMNPFVPLLLSHPASLYCKPPEMFQFASPEQALIFVQEHAPDWVISMIGSLFMSAHIRYANVAIKKLRNELRVAYDHLLDDLDEIDEEPWQDIILQKITEME